MGIFGSKEKANPPVIAQIMGTLPIAKAVEAVSMAGIPELLQSGGPQSVQDLAKTSGLKDDHLYRMLRALKSYGIFEESAGKWKNTPSSELLIPNTPGSLYTMVRHIMNESYNGYIHMYDGAKLDEKHNSWEIFSKGQELWAWYKMPENAFFLHNFNQFMVENSAKDMEPILRNYNWKVFENSTVADVGGGKGHLLRELVAKHPDMKGIVFDTKEMIEDAGEFWKSIDTETSNRVELVAGSFFSSVPKADVYIMKHILHDWSDEKCAEILNVMHPTVASNNAKVLIMEIVLPDDAPLAPWQSFIDLQMMCLVGGKERSAREWNNLLEKSNFKMERIVHTGARVNIIEATARVNSSPHEST